MPVDRTNEEYEAWLAQRKGQPPEDCIARNIVSGEMWEEGKE